MTDQTPPTDRPLTAGDVPLLREGDVLRCEGVDVTFTHSSLGVVHYRYDAAAIGSAPSECFTFVRRAAESAEEVGDMSDAITFMEAAAVMLGRGEMPAPGTQYAAKWYLAHRTVLDALSRPATSAASEGERPTLAMCEAGAKAITKYRSTHGTLVQAAKCFAAMSALASPPISERERELEGLFAALRENSWDLRCISLPTGGDDHEIGWRVIGHWQAAPRERTIAQVFQDDPAAAVRAALTAQPAGEGK